MLAAASRLSCFVLVALLCVPLSNQSALAATSGLALSSVTPGGVYAGAGDTNITVTGHGFMSSCVVEWNGIQLVTNATHWMGEVLTATVPSSRLTSPGTVSIVVFDTSSHALSSSQSFYIWPGTATALVPAIGSIEPTAAPAGSTEVAVTVYGTNLSNDGQRYSVMQWNGQSVPTGLGNAPNEIVGTVPAADLTTAGTGTITVRNADGSAGPGGVSNSVAFTIGTGPVVPVVGAIYVPPLSGSTYATNSATAGRGDTNISVTGGNFGTTGSGAIVNWNGTPLVTTWEGDNSLNAVVPAADLASPGTAEITVSVPSEGVSAPHSFAITGAGTSPWTGPQRVAIPSYIYPGPDWTRMKQAAPTVGMTVINPASGPGTSADANYISAVNASQTAGQTVLGYVHTSWGSRSLATVESEIDQYYSWYHVDGIFIDEVSTDCTSGGVESSYYQPLYSYIKAKTGKDFVALNPGTVTSSSSCYMNASDVLVPFEGDYSTYSSFSPPAWTSAYPANRFWDLVYCAGTVADMAGAVHHSKQSGAGWLYVTSEPGPGSSPTGANPWGALPAPGYWAGELAAVNAGPGLVNARTDAGAVGDGTTDDTAALQHGLSLLGAGGGVLYLPSATYSVAPTTLAVPSNVALVGDVATLKVNSLGFSSLDIQNNATNVGVTGVTVDGNNLAVRGMTVDSGAGNVYLGQDTFQNFTQPNTASTTLAASLFNQTPVGIRFEGNTSNIVVDGSTIQNVLAINTGGISWAHKVARGIWLDQSSGETISQNDVIRNSTFNQIAPKDDGDCIVAQDSNANANLVIDNNSFTYCHKRAIKIQSPGVTVTNNTITNPFLNNNPFDTYPGVFAFDMYSAISVYASNVTVSGNSISGTGSFYAAMDIGATECSSISNIAITNNSIQMGSGASLTGASLIRAFEPVSGFTITGNTGDYAQNGIVVYPGSSGVISSPNTMGSHVTIPFQTYGVACVTGLSPSSATAGIGNLTLAVSGTGFAPDSTVQWDGSALPTTYISTTQLQAAVPAADVAGPTTGSITVYNPSTGSLTSDYQPFFVTASGAAVSGSQTISSSGGTATASLGVAGPNTGLTAAASGAGSLTVAQYSADPAASAPPSAINAYFDLYAPSGFTSMTVTDCNLKGGNVVYYYDTGTSTWIPVSGQTYDSTTGCVTFTLNSTSVPSITQLSGTIFGVQRNLPPSLQVPVLTGVQYSDHVSFTVTAVDPEASDTITLSATALPSGLTFTDNGNGTGTVSGVVTASAGSYTATIIASDGFSSTTTAIPITVGREDTVVKPAQSNPAAVQVSAPGGSAPSTTFSARITEVTDGSYGDITRATPITFSLNPIGSGTAYTCTAVVTQTVAATPTSPGFIVADCTFPAGTMVNVYDLNVSVGGNYYQGSGDRVLTVFDPSQTAAAIGGGSVTFPNSGNSVAFGFTARYNKGGGVMGKMLFIETDPNGKQIAVVKGNNMNTMAITKPSGTYPETVKITGKATLNGNGNYSYVLQGVDSGGVTNDSDQYGFTLSDPSGVPVAAQSFAPQTLTTNGTGVQIGDIQVQ